MVNSVHSPRLGAGIIKKANRLTNLVVATAEARRIRASATAQFTADSPSQTDSYTSRTSSPPPQQTGTSGRPIQSTTTSPTS